MGRKTMKRYLFDLLTPNYVLFQSLAEYVLALPSSLKLGAPHPEQICIDLLRRGVKAKLKVEVFNSIGKDSYRTSELAEDFYRTPQEKFKIMKETWFPDVGKEENDGQTRPCTTVRNSDDKAIPLRWAHTQICILSTTAASFDQ